MIGASSMIDNYAKYCYCSNNYSRGLATIKRQYILNKANL